MESNYMAAVPGSISEEKWKLFLRRARLFRYIPFVDFVFATGSLATGNMHENSDFDVTVGARYGRIFTVRFISVLLFQIFGFRRKKSDRGADARDKICLSHFVTEKSYRLSPPHGSYWATLYRQLVPVAGSAEKIQKFWDANGDWMGERKLYENDARHLYKRKAAGAAAAEILLGGAAGNYLERILRRLQVRRIGGSSPAPHGAGEYKPRIICGDAELEFHPDTRRIELFDQTQA